MTLHSDDWLGVGIGVFLILIGVVILSVSLASGQDQQRSITSYKLQLEYVTKQRHQCEINLADIWEQGELLERENRQLKQQIEELKKKGDVSEQVKNVD